MKFDRENNQKTHLIQFELFVFYKLPCLQKKNSWTSTVIPGIQRGTIV